MDRDVIAGDDGIVAGQEGGDDGMRCPVCGNINLVGADICDNCGADIFGHDTPLQAPAFKGQLLGEHLDELGSPRADHGRRRYAARRGHRPDVTRRAPTASWSSPTSDWSASSRTATRW